MMLKQAKLYEHLSSVYLYEQSVTRRVNFMRSIGRQSDETSRRRPGTTGSNGVKLPLSVYVWESRYSEKIFYV
jgi:hypothetical protein